MKFINSNHQIKEIILEPQILIQGKQGILSCNEHLPKMIIKVSSQYQTNRFEKCNYSFEDKICIYVISKQQKTYFYQEVKECCVKTIGQQKTIIFENLSLNLKNKTYQFKKLNFLVLLTRTSQNQEIALQALISDTIRFYHYKFIHIITKQEIKQFFQIFSYSQNFQNQSRSQQIKLSSNIEKKKPSQIIQEIIKKILEQIDSEDIDKQFFLNIQGQPKIYIVVQNTDIWLVNKRLKGIIGFVKNYDKIPKKYNQLQIFPQKTQNNQNTSQLFCKKKNKQSLDDIKFPTNDSDQSQVQQKRKNNLKNKSSQKSRKYNTRKKSNQMQTKSKSQNKVKEQNDKQQFEIPKPNKKLKQQNQTQKFHIPYPNMNFPYMSYFPNLMPMFSPINYQELIPNQNKMKQQQSQPNFMMIPIQVTPNMKPNQMRNDPYQLPKNFPFSSFNMYGNMTEQPKADKRQASKTISEEEIYKGFTPNKKFFNETNRSEYINKTEQKLNQPKNPINMPGSFPINQPGNMPFNIPLNIAGMPGKDLLYNKNKNFNMFGGEKQHIEKKSYEEQQHNQNKIPNFMLGNMYNPYMFLYPEMMYNMYLMMNSHPSVSPVIGSMNPSMVNPLINPLMGNPPAPMLNNGQMPLFCYMPMSCPIDSNKDINHNKEIKKFKNPSQELKFEELKKNSQKKIQDQMKFKQCSKYKQSYDLKSSMENSEFHKLSEQFKIGKSESKLPQGYKLIDKISQLKQKLEK